MGTPTETPPPPSRWRSPSSLAAPIWVPVAGFVTALLIGSVAAAMGGVGDDTVTPIGRLLGQVGFWVGLLATVLVASRQWGSGDARHDLGATWTARDLVVGGGIGVATQVVVIPALYWLIQLVTGPLEVDAPARELFDESGLMWRLIVAVSAVVIAPVIEEVFFRGLLLGSLCRRLAPLVAAVVGSLMFAGTHFQVIQLPGLFVAGMVFSLLALRAGRLGPAVGAHVGFNATTVVALLVTNG